MSSIVFASRTAFCGAPLDLVGLGQHAFDQTVGQQGGVGFVQLGSDDPHHGLTQRLVPLGEDETQINVICQTGSTLEAYFKERPVKPVALFIDRHNATGEVLSGFRG